MSVVEFELVNGEPIVRGVNAAFTEHFGFDEATIVDEPLNARIVPDWLAEEAEALDQRTAAGEINYRRVRRETATGIREFLYRGIPYDDAETTTDGVAIYTDLTEITRTERRLQVLNRVLRHNLRNEVNVIVGNITQLLAELPEQSAETTAVAATVEAAAGDLERLTHEAGGIDTVLGSTPDPDRRVDCVALIHDIVTDYRDTAPHATFELPLPESLLVRASGMLRYATRGARGGTRCGGDQCDAPRQRPRTLACHVDGRVTRRRADIWHQ